MRIFKDVSAPENNIRFVYADFLLVEAPELNVTIKKFKK